ncbi:hypothetical protein BSR28_02245 [Boudabousia liubingyangii]|uniref:peptidoglycan D,D-transpeptidase FtsI family protein n=1 Tax=Boudabousia liubingyangii TaxID=1921764 RepID=UPI00093CDA2D|nr:penicillin-binding transpeptidase domain-containing protein [Boudabousia liubingyangii]OKL48530.1 hypothetical protein BSR28_02245 [Boudabousia liubingyangii]
MNQQIRRLMSAMALMVLSLLVAATYLQMFAAPKLVADSRNPRPIFESWKRDRGPIIVAGNEIAMSEKEDGAQQIEYQRVYPEGRIFAPITGYAAVRLGQYTGLELTDSAELDGTSDSLWTQRIEDLLTGRQPRGGAIRLTIDPKIQQAAFDALEGRRGAVVVLDVNSGEIKALVSQPTFDPNQIVQKDAKEARKVLAALQEDPDQPLINRAIAGNRYPPGSVFKIVTTAAALKQGLVTPDQNIDAPVSIPLPGTNVKLQNYGGESCGNGHPTFKFAFADSCNTPFAKLGMDLGWDALSEQAKAFGFEKDLAIPLKVTQSVVPETNSKAQVAQSAIGQFNVQVTPLQVAMISAAVANKGVIMKPFLIESTLNRDLVVQKTTEPKVFSKAMDAKTASQIKDMMVEVVNNGTGTSARIPGVQVAGKTGTAQSGRGSSHAWFTGFAPADAPQLAVAVVLEAKDNEYLTGGPDAGPIAAKILKAGLNEN